MVKKTIGIVIPTLNDTQNLINLLNILEEQTLLPTEIIVVDSSSNNQIRDYINFYKSPISIKYFRIGRAFLFDRFLFSLCKIFKITNTFKKYFDLPRAYPYEATNFGVKQCSSQYVVFLDTTTIPIKTWLEDYLSLCTKSFEVVFGSTKYFSNNYRSSLIHYSLWGNSHHETMPGSIIKRDNYLDGLLINEGVRAGGDVDWRIRVKRKHKWYFPKNYYIKYESIPNSIWAAVKKSFIYQLHSVASDIQRNTRNAYFLILVVLSFLIVPKWNSIVGWETSPLFIPNITKIYVLTFLSSSLIVLVANFKKVKEFFNSFAFGSTFKVALVLICFSIVYNWNSLIAKWVEESAWFFPHITKIYISFLVFLSFLYRGIFVPIRNNVALRKVFPFNFILIGAVGVLLDLAKMPGYLIGAIINFIRDLKSIFIGPQQAKDID